MILTQEPLHLETAKFGRIGRGSKSEHCLQSVFFIYLFFFIRYKFSLLITLEHALLSNYFYYLDCKYSQKQC